MWAIGLMVIGLVVAVAVIGVLLSYELRKKRAARKQPIEE